MIVTVETKKGSSRRNGTVVYVTPPAEFASRAALFSAIGELMAIEFEPVSHLPANGVCVIFGASPQARTCRSSISFPGRVASEVRDTPIAFAVDFAPVMFRRWTGQVQTLQVEGFANIADAPVIASTGRIPVWYRASSERGIHDTVTVSLPDCREGAKLNSLISGSAWLPIISLIDFLRHAIGQVPPPMRAAIMIDDPNLHSSRYGFIDFRRLVECATKNDYHVSIATIPLDTWYTSADAVSVFKQHSDRVSLLMHGNNHTKSELARGNPDFRLRSFAQGVRRVERFERRTGLAVSRIMAAPHGACSAETCGILARLGFEAAYISDASLHYWNSGVQWSSLFGVAPAEFCHGFPLLPRTGFPDSSASQLRTYAFLGRPLVMVGHHSDCCDNFSKLNHAAAIVNSFGPVLWTNVSSIARRNFFITDSGLGQTVVRPFANLLRVSMNPDVRELVVRIPDGQPLEVAAAIGGATFRTVDGSIEIEDSPSVDLRLSRIDTVAPASVKAPPLSVWPVVRRLLCEVRDRVQPRTAAYRS